MSFKAVALLALAAGGVARAHPKRHHHHHGTGTGTGGFVMPTGGPFNMHNSTDGSDFEAGSSSVVAATLTVVPLPASSTTAFATSSIDDAVDVINQVFTTVAAQGTTTSCTSSSTITTTVTSIQYYSVTVTGDFAAAVTSAASEDVAFSATSTLDLSNSASVVAGDFFQYSSFGPFRGSSSAAAPSVSIVPSTFTTAMISTTGAAASMTFSSSAAAATTTIPASTGSSGKKGLSYNIASLTDAFAGQGMSWAYNWASSQGGTLISGLEYVPMLWGQNSVDGWSSAALSAISAGSSHLLSFNEPDLSTQSNMSPSVAAALHIAQMNPLSGQAQIGSPAVTNGAGSSPPMGTTWLSQFFTACNGQCKVDFVAFHYYNDASQIDDFMSHVSDVISTAAANGVSKVWLTEFGATGSDADVASFLSQALTFLDSQSAVERYAYFMCGDGTLLSGSSLSTIGEAYVV